jgi:N-methylhydantoinase A
MDRGIESGIRVAIDVGGTFTDIVIAADGQRGIFTYKILNHPEQLGQQINDCIRDSLERSSAGSFSETHVAAIVFGTTKCSNTVLENSGAKTALLCTKGFRDLLELRDGSRPPIHSIFWDPIPPLVPRRRRLEIAERILATGEIYRAIDENDVSRAIRVLKEQGTEAVAIAFLHSYKNPVHEKAVLSMIKDEMPEAWVCASHEILPEIREYPRTSTTVINAFLMKTVSHYLDEVENQLRHYNRPLLIMQSNGGIMTSGHARRQPIRMLESGPAAGVLAAVELACELDLKRAVAFDMGGTTVKACLIEDGVAAQTQDCEVGAGVNGAYGKGAGYAVRVAAFDIVEIGAGGGSIAHLDGGTLLRVGPESAGSWPGPVCYARGGARPTVTDANVVLGYMNPTKIAGGAVRIDYAGARRAIESDFGLPLGLSAEAAAYGIHRVANSTMVRAVRSVTSERGRDPRDYTLIAFGGAGPIHAAALAEDIGIRRAIVPLFPGLFSSVGLQFANQLYDRLKSVFIPVQADKRAEVVQLCEEVEADLRQALGDMDLQRGSRIEYRHAIDLRQSMNTQDMTLEISNLGNHRLLEELMERFHLEHENAYGYRREGEPLFITNIRVKAIISSHAVSPRELLKSSLHQVASNDVCAERSVRQAYFGPQKGRMAAQVIPRFDLLREPVLGPVIVEEFDTTVVIPPGWTAELDSLANIVLELN